MVSLESCAYIESVANEFDFWRSAQVSKGFDRDFVNSICIALEPIRDSFRAMGSFSWTETGEVIDQVQEALNEAWKVDIRSNAFRSMHHET